MGSVDVLIPIVDAIESACNSSVSMEPGSLAEALDWLDADRCSSGNRRTFTERNMDIGSAADDERRTDTEKHKPTG
jgi:hypothetical protein